MYRPKPLIFPPNAKRDSELQQIATYLQGELQNIANSMQIGVDAIRLNVLHKEPEKPSAGMIVYAGSDWDADGFGTGEGPYYRNEDNTAWVFFGA